jgi:hypothetical protein
MFCQDRAPEQNGSSVCAKRCPLWEASRIKSEYIEIGIRIVGF